MDNPEKLATPSTQDKGWKKNKNKHNIENYKDKYRGPMLGRHKF